MTGPTTSLKMLTSTATSRCNVLSNKPTSLSRGVFRLHEGNHTTTATLRQHLVWVSPINRDCYWLHASQNQEKKKQNPCLDHALSLYQLSSNPTPVNTPLHRSTQVRRLDSSGSPSKSHVHLTPTKRQIHEVSYNFSRRSARNTGMLLPHIYFCGTTN